MLCEKALHKISEKMSLAFSLERASELVSSSARRVLGNDAMARVKESSVAVSFATSRSISCILPCGVSSVILCSAKSISAKPLSSLFGSSGTGLLGKSVTFNMTTLRPGL